MLLHFLLKDVTFGKGQDFAETRETSAEFYQFESLLLATVTMTSFIWKLSSFFIASRPFANEKN